MTHTITLTDDQFARLRAISRLSHRSPEQVVADLLSGLPMPAQEPPIEEYDRRWDDFMRLVGSIEEGQPLTNEEIDELIGEEAAAEHATDASDPDARA